MALPIINSPIKIPIAFLAIVVISSISSCYYDNEEYLYPNQPLCDTLQVSYSAHVAPVMALHCNSCHSASAPSAGIVTDNYNSLRTIALNGRLPGAINHRPGYSPMPKGGNKLNNCDLARIDAWIRKGAPDN